MADTIDVQISRLSKRLNAIAAVDVPRATSSAINKIVRKVRTRVVRGVAKTERLPNKAISRKVFVKTSTARTQRARIRVYRGDVSVASLLSKTTVANRMGRGTNRRGVTVRGRSYPGAFINRGNKGNVQVFERSGSSRYPIEAVKIPISGSVDKIAPVVAERVHRQDFLTETRRELDFRLRKRLGTL